MKYDGLKRRKHERCCITKWLLIIFLIFCSARLTYNMKIPLPQKMNVILKLALAIFPLFCFCQQNGYDSLKRAFYVATTDSARFAILDAIAERYTENNFDSAIYYTEKAIGIASKNDKSLDQARALDLKGYNLMHLSKLSASFQVLSEALQIAENTESEKKSWDRHALDSPRRFRLKILESIHHEIGHLMGSAGKTDQQLYHYGETRKIAASIHDTSMLGFVNMNVGNVYLGEKKNLDSALEMEKTAERCFVQTGDKRYLGVVYQIMGDISEQKNDNSAARAYFYKGIAISSAQDNEADVADIYDDLTEHYLTREKNKDSSLFYAKKTLQVLESIGVKNLGDVYDHLSKAYEMNNNRDSAFKYQGMALNAKNIASRERIKSLTDVQKLSFDEQFRLQELEKEKIETQNKIRTYSFLGGIGIILLFLLLLYRNNLASKKNNQILKQQKEKIETTLTELKSAQSQLIQSEKMASLGELTAGIAHEIQNPLNFVNNFSEVNKELIEELEAERSKGNGERDEQLEDQLLKDIRDNEEKINHHGKRADAIVKGMLQHSRSSVSVKEPADINALADEYLRLSYHGLRAKDNSFNATMNTDFDDSIGKIDIIPQDIGRVLLNLYNNAFYAVNEKKKTAGENYQPTVSVSTKKSGDQVYITVNDNGNGIPQKIVDKIFQPFFTTKPTGQGTGLGLSLSYDIIKAHGGAIKVNTKENEESEFTIELPLK